VAIASDGGGSTLAHSAANGAYIVAGGAVTPAVGITVQRRSEVAGNRSASNNDSMRNNTQQQPKRRNTPNVLLPRR
jgi:hypothetical protein